MNILYKILKGDVGNTSPCGPSRSPDFVAGRKTYAFEVAPGGYYCNNQVKEIFPEIYEGVIKEHKQDIVQVKVVNHFLWTNVYATGWKKDSDDVSKWHDFLFFNCK